VADIVGTHTTLARVQGDGTREPLANGSVEGLVMSLTAVGTTGLALLRQNGPTGIVEQSTDGGAWEAIDLTDPENPSRKVSATGVYAAGDSPLYVLTDDELYVVHSGALEAADVQAEGLVGSGADDLWALQAGFVAHWDGSGWDTPVDIEGSCAYGVALSAASIECVGTGSSSRPQHYDGGAWSEDPTDAGWVLGLAAHAGRIAAISDRSNGLTLTVSSRTEDASWEHQVVDLGLDETKAYSPDDGAAFLPDGRLVFAVYEREAEVENAYLVLESP
jgi:hypothetical protein